MLLFLLSYLAIYGGAHAWLLTRTLRAFHLPFPWPVLFALLAIFMIMAPILVRILERAGLHSPVNWVAYLGYGWMGWAPPIRVFAPPEVAVIDIVPAS